MSTQFQLVLAHDKIHFHLVDGDGKTLLVGLPGTSKIMVQNDILHLRSALRDRATLVPHRGSDGSHFLTVKDQDGSVLAKSPHLPTAGDCAALAEAILAVAAKAPIIDKTKHASVH